MFEERPSLHESSLTSLQLADPIDLHALVAALPSKPALVLNVPEYSHMDFVWSITAAQLVYSPLLEFFSKVRI